MPSIRPRAVCIVSGGIDSVCYAAMLASKYDIYMMTFSYGQRARREIERARLFSKILKAKVHKVVDISFMKSLYGRSNSLTDSHQELASGFEQSLIVPIRNAVFITIATAWAMSIGAKVIAYGAHAGDSTHYPDCRPAFVKSLNSALNLAESDSIASGLRQQVTISSPAMLNLDKASILKDGYGILGDRIFRTWSCYSDGIKSGRDYVHCGRCESCINRKNAFSNAGIEDKTTYASKDGGKRKSGKTQRDIY
ncbi:MAG: 7-cyano-7-deazaguanine synthase QueC [Nitrososphaera sp.]